MTEPHHPDPVTTGPEQQFLHQILAHLDRWFDDPTNDGDLQQARTLLQQRIPVATELDENNTDSARPALAGIGAELQHARRDGALISIRTRGGHHHRAVRVDAVHRHHARLSDRTDQGVLMPLAFIESIARLASRHEQ